MLIDNCGSNSDKLKEIYNSMLKAKSGSNEEITEDTKELLDSEIFQVYQTILSFTNDGNAVALALYDFSKRVAQGNIEVSELSSLAVDVATEASMAENVLVVPEEIDESTQDAFAAIAILGGMLNEREKETVSILCTDELEDSFKGVFEKAQAGDRTSQKVLDLINRAEGYIVNRDRLNPKGAASGALALVYQLTSTGDSAALEVAEKIASTFGLDEIIENGTINPDKVKEVFARKHPNHDLDETNRRHDKYVENNTESILKRGTSSNRENVTQKLERSRLQGLSKQIVGAIKTGNIDEITRLVQENRELAEKLYGDTRDLYERCGKGKKGGDILLSKMKAIGMALGKDGHQMSDRAEQNDER